MTADSYKVQLRMLGSVDVLRSETTSEAECSFGGIVMGAAYRVELTCVFGDRQGPNSTRKIKLMMKFLNWFFKISFALLTQ